MKNYFKTLIASVVLFAGLAGHAQNYVVENMLNVRSLGLGTNGTSSGVTNPVNYPGIWYVTNTFWTNLTGGTEFVGVTNSVFTYTNTQAGYIFSTNANVISTFPLFKDAGIWTDREGRTPVNWVPTLNAAGPLTTNALAYSVQTLLIRCISVAGTNSAFTFVFQPMYGPFSHNNTNVLDWTVSFPVGAAHGIDTTKATVFATNCPTWLWPGASGLRLNRIVPVTTDGNIGAITNRVFFTDIDIVGFKP